MSLSSRLSLGKDRRTSLAIGVDPQATVINNGNLPAIDLESAAIKKGWLFKRGGGKKSTGWKKRYCILLSQVLYYYKSNTDKKAQGRIHPLTAFILVDQPNDPKQGRFEFQLKPKDPNGRIYCIYAASENDKIDWMDVLTTATQGVQTDAKSVQIVEDLRRKHLDIPPNDLEWSASVLGKGASGIVKKGLWLKTTDVAIKALNNLPEFTDQEEQIGFYREIETLSQLRHPNIVPMFGFCKKEGYICLVTEFVKGGNLSESIHNPQIRLDLPLQIELCCSICRGMVYLHNKKVIHRDLKPGNILVENLDEATVKVCDFGLSTITKNKDEGQMTKNTYGSPAYAAPELPTETHTNKVDVFSFAVIAWEICTRQKPWMSVSHAWQIGEKIAKGERLPLAADHPLSPLIEKCWALDPDQRPSFAEIFEELNRIKTSLGISNHGNGTGPASPALPRSGTMTPTMRTSFLTNQFTIDQAPEQRIAEAFGSRSKISWTDFSRAVSTTLGTTQSTIDKLKFTLIGDDGMVDKQAWEEFLKWFTPLGKAAGLYQTQNAANVGADEQDGYTIEVIADIVGPSWFFGFLNANVARDLLLSMPVGSFLFRFSSNPGYYTLSVNYGQVGHWRISTEKLKSEYPTFKIDDYKYKSLHDIIAQHSSGGVPLSIKTPGFPDCALTTPADRNVAFGSEPRYTSGLT